MLGQGTILCHPLSFAFWFKLDAKPPQTQLLLNQSGPNYYFAFQPSTNAADQNVSLSFASLDWSLNLTSPAKYSATRWHHVVIVYDGASGRMYVDGVKAADQPCMQIMGYVPGNPLLLGGGFGNPGFLGALADFVIWNRPLAPAEAARLYAEESNGTWASPAPVAPSGLAAQALPAGLAQLSWQDNSLNETSFALERAVAGGSFSAIAILPANTTSYTDTLPDSSAAYCYRIKARNSFGDSDYSKLAALGTPVPGTPAGLHIQAAH